MIKSLRVPKWRYLMATGRLVEAENAAVAAYWINRPDPRKRRIAIA